ncbi:MAG: uracil-DNA glycosylase family protein [Fibrobacterota bacterium]
MSRKRILKATEILRDSANALSFTAPVTHVYNPLVYAWKCHKKYVEMYGGGKKKVVFVGMNPGPWGMAQTGVPFGEINAVRDWLCIEGCVDVPVIQHPKRPVDGFACKRSEVSGKRLWGLFKERFISPQRFFEEHYVANYCPLVFMEESGRNRTPDKLPVREREKLFRICNEHLLSLIHALNADYVIGIGNFAYTRMRDVCDDSHVRCGKILHPSPSNPIANKDWAGYVKRQLFELKIWA